MSDTNSFPHSRPPYEVENFPDLDNKTYPLAQGKDCVFGEDGEFKLVEASGGNGDGGNDDCIDWKDFIRSGDYLDIQFHTDPFKSHRPTLPPTEEDTVYFMVARVEGNNSAGNAVSWRTNEIPYDPWVWNANAIAYTNWGKQDPAMAEAPTVFGADFMFEGDYQDKMCEDLVAYPDTVSTMSALPFTASIPSSNITLTEANTIQLALGVFEGRFTFMWMGNLSSEELGLTELASSLNFSIDFK